MPNLDASEVDPSSCGHVGPEQLDQRGRNYHISNIDDDV